MRRALRLAKRGRTSPNPMVGAVVVRDGRIVGEGFHPRAGDPHAETFALSAASEAARGGTLYVTLEPCCHYGRTPPCTKAIIQAGVARVVAAMVDPNPRIQGKGLKKLQDAGIEISMGLLEDQAQRLNEAYIKYITTGLPFVRLKMAMTLDGKIATNTGESRWITGEAAGRYVHRLRAKADAVVVGIGTILKDNPRLTARSASGVQMRRQPDRVVVDSMARTPPDAAIFDAPGKVIIAATNRAPNERIKRLEQKGARILLLNGTAQRVDLTALARELAARGMMNVLVEGGGELAAGFLEAKLVDAVTFLTAPKILGGREAPTAVAGIGVRSLEEAINLRDIRVRRFGEDVCIEGYVERQGPPLFRDTHQAVSESCDSRCD